MATRGAALRRALLTSRRWAGYADAIMSRSNEPDPEAPDPDSPVDLLTLGVCLQVGLAGASPAQVDRFRTLWQLCLADSPGARLQGAGGAVDGGRLDVGDRFAALSADDPHAESRLLMHVTQEITRALIEAQAGRVILLHAGALADPCTGASIVYVAPGGTGKTTLSHTLGPELAYLTDETVAITSAGVILPYPKPLSIRRDPYDGLKDETGPTSLGLRLPDVTPWVAGVVLLRRDGGAHAVSIEQVEVLDALVKLAPESSSLARLPRALQQVAHLLESTGGLQVLCYDEATTLRSAVLEITGRTR